MVKLPFLQFSVPYGPSEIIPLFSDNQKPKLLSSSLYKYKTFIRLKNNYYFIFRLNGHDISVCPCLSFVMYFAGDCESFVYLCVCLYMVVWGVLCNR